jgi:myo-inositol-1(or 4)-monophosphatase
VSIALEHKGQIVSGVIYDPTKDEMFYAEKGFGAFLNESRLRVSSRGRMSESLFATGLPFSGRADLPETLQDLARILPACVGVRRFGSAALDLAYVAAGRYEGYWERRLNSWDIAAGIIIVKEAGGLIEPLDPKGDIMTDGELVCGNEAIFETFAKVVRKA